MIKAKVKRLFGKYASVRSYLVEEARNNYEGIEIHYGRSKMTIPFTRLMEGITNRKKFRSRYDKGKDYHLVDFEWVADDQGDLFRGDNDRGTDS